MDLYNVAEIELTYKRNAKTTERPKITNAEDAYKILVSQWDENKLDFIEQAKIMLLNRAGRVLGICNISSGGVAGTVVDTRLVFATALKTNASSIILAHNHPSANLVPSDADKNMHRRMTDAGRILDITLWDNLIISSEGFYSFAEGMAFEKVTYGNTVFLEAVPPF